MDQARHSPDHGGSLVLDNDVSAGVANMLGSEHTVRTHAGHHYSENVCAVGQRHRTKQHIDRWPAGILRTSLIQVQTPVHTRVDHFHVEISGRDPAVPRGATNAPAPLFPRKTPTPADA